MKYKYYIEKEGKYLSRGLRWIEKKKDAWILSSHIEAEKVASKYNAKIKTIPYF